MQKLHFSIVINAPVKKVWDTMLDDQTYRQWTEPFMPGGYFEGDWGEGSEMRFLATDEKGESGGMIGHIKTNRPNEFLSIEYSGIVEDGKDITSGEKVEGWNGALENYTFKDLGDGKTELQVDVDMDDEFLQIMQDAWPKALQKLKALAAQ